MVPFLLFFLALGKSPNLELSFLLVEGENVAHTRKAHDEFLSKTVCKLVVSLGL